MYLDVTHKKKILIDQDKRDCWAGNKKTTNQARQVKKEED